MRTLCLTAACLLGLHTSAFAENLSVIEQIGNAHSTTVQQQLLDGGGDNSSTIWQEGTGHSVSVNQLSVNANTLTIEQSGVSQEAHIDQRSDPVGNDAAVRQAGLGNRVTILQIGDGSGGFSHYAEIEQAGQENVADIEQYYHSASSIIRQTGDDNHAKSIQTPFDASLASFIEQAGTGNNAEVRQTGFFTAVTSEIFQLGEGNHAVVQQDASYLLNEALIRQDGGANLADVRQAGGYARGKIDIDQSGDTNEATLLQDGGDMNNFATVAQSGSGNKVATHQTGNYTINTLDIIQDGSDNSVAVLQIGAIFSNIAAQIEQTGSMKSYALILVTAWQGLDQAASLWLA